MRRKAASELPSNQIGTLPALWHRPALHVTPENAPDCAEDTVLAGAVQEATGADGRSGIRRSGIALAVVKLELTRRGLDYCPGTGRLSASLPGLHACRMAKYDERLPEVVEGLYFLAFASLMLRQLVPFAAQSP
jgi:hypothetical protein